jgi:hypothetical protein
MEEELTFEAQVEQLRQRHNLAEVDLKEVQKAFDEQKGMGGYVYRQHHYKKELRPYLLNLEYSGECYYNPELITFYDVETYKVQ